MDTRLGIIKNVRYIELNTLLALQLHLPFQVGLVGFGLVASAPDGPCDDESGFDLSLS
jgi:hypothetical protein